MKLLPIYPRGVGTVEVESLSSYLLRCAISHQISGEQLVRVLIEEIADPKCEEPSEIKFIKNASKRMLASASLVRNNRVSLGLAAILDRVYGTEAFKGLGLFSLGNTPFRVSQELMSGYRWCPLCWEEDLDKNQQPYFRYIWSFHGHAKCERHGVVLQERCSHCSAPVSFAYRPDLWRCKMCDSSLLGRSYPSGQDQELTNSGMHDLVDLVEFIQANPRWLLDFQALVGSDSKGAYAKESAVLALHGSDPICKKFQRKPTFYNLRQACFFLMLICGECYPGTIGSSTFWRLRSFETKSKSELIGNPYFRKIRLTRTRKTRPGRLSVSPVNGYVLPQAG
jgi:hypothetical protein